MAQAVRNYDRSRTGGSKPSERITRQRLRVALWICRTKKIDPTDDMLAAMLGEKMRDAYPLIQEMKTEMGFETK
jgi:hypothetical protein